MRGAAQRDTVGRVSLSWDALAGGRAAEVVGQSVDMTFTPEDRATGQPATPFTPAERRYVEYFLAGTEPGAVSAWRLFQWGPLGAP